MSTQRQIDYCEWTLRRLRNAETQLYQYQDNDIFRDPEKYPLRKSGTNIPRSFTQLQRRVDSTRRAIHRALQTLEKLKAAPDPAPPGEPDPLALEPPSLLPSPQTTSPQIGFVPAPPSPPHASRRPHPRAPVPTRYLSVLGTLRWLEWRAHRQFPTSMSRTPLRARGPLDTKRALNYR